MKLFGSLFLACLIFPSALRAQFGPPLGGDGHVEASLVSEVDAVAPGEPFWVALRLEHDDTWHTYWRFAGDAGAPTEIAWKLPEGFTAGPIQWPVPKVYLQQDIVNYVYEGTAMLMVRIEPPAELTADTVTLEAEVDWLECDPNQCVPGGAEVSLTLPITQLGAGPSEQADAFARAREQWAQPLPDDWGAEIRRRNGRFVLDLTPPRGITVDATETYVFPIDGQTETLVPPEADLESETRDRVAARGRFLERERLTNGTLRYRLPVSPYAPADLERFRVVLKHSDGWPGSGARGFRINLPAPPESNGGGGADGAQADATGATAATGDGGPSEPIGSIEAGGVSPSASLPLPLMLLFALVGGLILNVMPCVFPVLGLKIMGFVQQAGEQREKIVHHGLAFTGGVLVTFWILAALLIVLQGSWGFQMQSPTFVTLLTFFFLLFGLNLSGVFEIGTSATGVGGSLMNQGGLKGSFFTGALAVVVATPCSAPFLATALAGTATLHAAAIVAIFTAIAIGLSLPYLLLSIFPQYVSALPKPGAWMETFKQALAFPLYAFTGYLLYVLADLVSAEIFRNVAVGLAFVALGAWLWGRYNTPVTPKRRRHIAAAVSLLLVVAIPAMMVSAIIEQGRREALQAEIAAGLTEASQADFLSFQPWSPAAVESALAEGKPVYIDFTARWCATCQTNKRVYDNREVIEAYRAADVVMLRADFTSRDPQTAAAIRSYGANAIPLNVLHVPEESSPYVFSAWLTPSELTDALEEKGLDVSTSMPGAM
ncbi:MAG: protein-disulfide reductase DsbD family protein [Opitutales bacterium]